MTAAIADRSGRASCVERAAERFERSARAIDAFFSKDSDCVAATCMAMADRFLEGGRLLAVGVGSGVSDAHHVAVEFVHPVIVGKRALPALALNPDPCQGSFDLAISRRLDVIGARSDILLALPGVVTGAHSQVLERAAQMGMLSIVLGGRDTPPCSQAQYSLTVDEADPMIVQEVHETVYHVLWELVHVFLDRAESGRGGRRR
ncbi:MAG: phosphoheptose isomerase [Gemmatimonadota bacterium]